MPNGFLGKGLSALIPKKSDAPQPAAPTVPGAAPLGVKPPARAKRSASRTEHGDAVFAIEIDKITPNPDQPRKDFNKEALTELADSIREHGIIQPLVVSKLEHETASGTGVEYRLIAGERRLRAAKIAGLNQVPVVIRAATPRDSLAVSLVENIQRDDLNPLEEARAFRRLLDEFKLLEKEVAQRVGKSRVAVANTIRLLTLPAEIQKGVAEGRISEGHARAILMVKKPLQQKVLFERVLNQNLSVREAEETARVMLGSETKEVKSRKLRDPETVKLAVKLAEALGARVKVDHTPAGRGHIKIGYASVDERSRLIKRLLAG
ncbi:ParB/RepB/Spo0J family partition protein [Candidatus Parcubacteria bacterium]|nr:ParB/RepB/Spo0J family partition protein [Candidatus Parcubacteria bacterium]